MKHLTPYEDGLNERLQDPEFKAIWEAGAVRRATTSAFIGARIKYKLSGKQLANLSGVSPATITRIESGTITPTLETLDKLAKAMGNELKIKFT